MPTSEPPLRTALRASALSGASAAGLPSVVAGAAARFGAWATAVTTGAPPALPADIAPAVFASAVRWGASGPLPGGGANASAFEVLLAALGATDDAAAKRRYLGALAASRDTTQLSALLAVALDTAVVRPQVRGALGAPASVLAHPAPPRDAHFAPPCHVHVHAHTHTRTRPHPPAHTHTHTHTHAHTHTHTSHPPAGHRERPHQRRGEPRRPRRRLALGAR